MDILSQCLSTGYSLKLLLLLHIVLFCYFYSVLFPSQDIIYHNKSITTITLISGDHHVQLYTIIFSGDYVLKQLLSSLALRLHRLQVQRGLHLSSAQLRPQQLTLLSSHFPSLQPGRRVSLPFTAYHYLSVSTQL